ncbi:MAG TPA: histidinol-phosphate transaminase [Chitinophagaceae bacterium]|jgi:histidinol-phosphate aminotransferase|nr:histidinol-phosphate transaminase [Chitinophagaceae bacterium]
MFDLDLLTRENVKKLIPYSSARDDFKGEAKIFLDANENSLGSPLTKWYNRYPDPHQLKVKEKLSEIKKVPVDQIFLGNGSDECIDILQRAFCEPGIDNLIICPPTYGMYEVCANINNVQVKKVKLTPEFQLDLEAIEQAIDDRTKMIFLCSPNNPTANSLHHKDVEVLLNNYFGLIVIDEAYINFSRQKSFATQLDEYPNLVVMQTLSKAWGLAALRVGITLASKQIVAIMNKIKPPYNINQASQELALQALDEVEEVNEMIIELVKEREVLTEALVNLSLVEKVYPSDANFLLVKVNDAVGIYKKLLDQGIVVRDRSRIELCEGCLRITVGTTEENKTLLYALAAIG